MRCLVVSKCIEVILFVVFNKKNKRIGKTIVNKTTANNLTLIKGNGMYLGAFEK